MESQKDIAISFLKNASSGELDEAYSKVSPNFRQERRYI